MKVRDEKKLTSIPNKKYLQSTMTKMGISDCKGSVSPKLDKVSMGGDNEEIDEEQTARFRSSVLALLYLSNENGHSKHGAFSVYETEKHHSIGDAATEAITEIRQG